MLNNRRRRTDVRRDAPQRVANETRRPCAEPDDGPPPLVDIDNTPPPPLANCGRTERAAVPQMAPDGPPPLQDLSNAGQERRVQSNASTCQLQHPGPRYQPRAASHRYQQMSLPNQPLEARNANGHPPRNMQSAAARHRNPMLPTAVSAPRSAQPQKHMPGPPQQRVGPPQQSQSPPQQMHGPQQRVGPPQQRQSAQQKPAPPQQMSGPPQNRFGKPQQRNGKRPSFGNGGSRPQHLPGERARPHLQHADVRSVNRPLAPQVARDRADAVAAVASATRSPPNQPLYAPSTPLNPATAEHSRLLLDNFNEKISQVIIIGCEFFIYGIYM